MNAIAKASTFVLVLATLPLVIGSLVTLSGCDKFKKGGDADAAAEGGPVPTAVDTTTPTDSATPSATAITTPTWHPVAHVDGGAKLGDAGVIKLGDGGFVAPPIPTPIPAGTLKPPPGFPTALPTTIPTTMPSGLVIPTAFPTAAPKASH